MSSVMEPPPMKGLENALGQAASGGASSRDPPSSIGGRPEAEEGQKKCAFCGWPFREKVLIPMADGLFSCKPCGEHCAYCSTYIVPEPPRYTHTKKGTAKPACYRCYKTVQTYLKE